MNELIFIRKQLFLRKELNKWVGIDLQKFFIKYALSIDQKQENEKSNSEVSLMSVLCPEGKSDQQKNNLNVNLGAVPVPLNETVQQLQKVGGNRTTTNSSFYVVGPLNGALYAVVNKPEQENKKTFPVSKREATTNC